MIAPAVREIYGLHLTGVAGSGLLPASGADRPRVAVRHEAGGAAPARAAAGPPRVGPDRAVVSLPGGRQVVLCRGEGSATFTGVRPAHDELVHPYLGVAAGVFSRWSGREVFHAGAFVRHGLAWAVVGAREAGKSSLLAALAARGVPVLADDLAVTDGRQVFCGPRILDLRQPPPPGITFPLTRARGGTRWRLWLPPMPSAAALGGWIYLAWQDEVAMSVVPASALLARLAARRAWPALPSAPARMLALAARPAWQLGRPADWSRMDEAVDLLLSHLAAARRR